MEPTVVMEAWKVGGIVGALLVLLALVLWFVLKDGRSRERRMATALDSCQAKHVEMAATTATALANNTSAFEKVAAAIDQQTRAMQDRPCLKDPTPPGGTRRPFPTPRPPSDHRH